MVDCVKTKSEGGNKEEEKNVYIYLYNKINKSTTRIKWSQLKCI